MVLAKIAAPSLLLELLLQVAAATAIICARAVITSVLAVVLAIVVSIVAMAAGRKVGVSSVRDRPCHISTSRYVWSQVPCGAVVLVVVYGAIPGSHDVCMGVGCCD